MSDNFDTVDVELRLNRFNKNYVGTQFGGSLYAMCDPFFMLILIERLGRDYIVWDKAANIRFKKPGKGTVKAHFHISDAKVAEIKALADSQPKVEPTFEVEVKDAEGNVIAEISKLLYVKRKEKDASYQGTFF